MIDGDVEVSFRLEEYMESNDYWAERARYDRLEYAQEARALHPSQQWRILRVVSVLFEVL